MTIMIARLIGQEFSYIRADSATGDVTRSTGILKSIFAGPAGRLMAQVKDGDQAYNIDYACLEASTEFEDAYTGLIKRVRAISEEGNRLVRKLVEEYNHKVELEYNSVIGEPVTYDRTEVDSEGS